MAWGGGGGFGGGHFGGGGHPGSTAGGLSFAGIPPELAEAAERLSRDEPDFADAHEPFRHEMPADPPLSLRSMVRPHRWALVGALLVVVVETLAVQAGPVLTQIGIDRGVLRGDSRVVLLAASAYVAAVVAGTAAGAGRVAWTGRVGQRLLRELRIRVFGHLQRLSLDFFTEEKAGRIMTRMTSDIEALNQLLQEGLVTLLVQGLTLVVITGVLLFYDVRLALVTLVVVLPVMTWLSLWYRRRSDAGYTLVRDEVANVLADLQENLAGIRVVTASHRQDHNVRHHRGIVGRYRAANVETGRLNAVYGPTSDTIGIVGQAVVLLIGGWMVLHGQLTIGKLTAFVLYLSAFFAPIQQLVQLYTTYQSGQAATRKLRALLATAPTVVERPGAPDLPPVRGEIVLDDVSFAYVPGRPVLRDVDLVVPVGETLALVGPTGAGKSTIAKLVTRFHDATGGRVLVDGHDLREVSLHSLRRQLGVVPQEPFLFAGTLRDNLAFARPDAADEEIAEAARVLGLDRLISRLPEGLDTYTHERGASLSAGERQLVALCRAMLAQPAIIVLDEATSNLDVQSEQLVEHALDVLLAGRTAILVAHRLSTAMRADRIAVVEDGRIVEIGPHEQLVASGGRYAAMHEIWERSGAGERSADRAAAS